MKRRDFLAASAAAGLAAAPIHSASAAEEDAGRDVIELRLYTFASEEKRNAFEEFLAQAMVPALNRAGVRPVGAFRALQADNPKVDLPWATPMLYVLLTHKSLQSVADLDGRLAADAAYQEAGKAILNAPKADPAYTRYESSVLLGFPDAPRVLAPATAPTRLLQLRIYESHNEERAAKKRFMFNQGGELGVFRACGMTWVFFGQCIAGPKMPRLTYMLAFDTQEAMDKAWGEFRKHPDWQKLSKDPAYADTTSTITNIILRPAGGSQI